MTTQSWSSRWRHDSDATFQEWASDLYNKLVACGLVQHTDTGQLATPVVASRPGTNTLAGFWIFRFADSQQSVAPIYIKVEVGTLAGATTPRMFITVGTGTNGTGTITGTAISVATTPHTLTTNAHTADTTRQSFFCHTDGFFGMRWKMGDSLETWFFCERTRDSTGAATATGSICGWGDSTSGSHNTTQAFRYAATAVAYPTRTSVAGQALGMSAQTPAGSVVGSDIQCFVGFTITPRMEPILGLVGVYDSEVTSGSTFSATVLGTAPHTYLALSTVGPFGPVAASSTGGIKCAMLWE